ncbi:hypothetical protein L4D76_26510 [Photobacterium sagamiensis]|uniref:hypothetical protein n=1 Tax=Photobacterium sagamiensis TaxID=2910241 RepID=UPI003D09F048
MHAEDLDMRAFQHGLDILSLPNGKYVSIWSSAGIENLRMPNKNGEWSHDVFASSFSRYTSSFSPRLLISAPDHSAQEPASTAITNDGHIMVTMEDAYQARNTLMQSYAVFDSKLNPVAPYQQVAFDGGHSGHVTAVDNRFVIFFSEGWVEGGGVDNLGSGDDVLLKTFDANGKELDQLAVSTGEEHRDWWPILAGSQRVALLVWQRFVNDETHALLMCSVYNPETNQLINQPVLLRDDLQYYTYDVQYLPAVNRFLITGTTEQQNGFAYLIDEQGKVVNQKDTLPPFVREAQPAIRSKKNVGNQKSGTEKVVYPIFPSGLMVLDITENSVDLGSVIEDTYQWSYIGTDGVFFDDHNVYFQTLSQRGIQEKWLYVP